MGWFLLSKQSRVALLKRTIEHKGLMAGHKCTEMENPGSALTLHSMHPPDIGFGIWPIVLKFDDIHLV